MKKFRFMIAFFVCMAVFFWASTFDIRNVEDRTIWATIFATVWGVVVFLGINELTKKFQ